MTSIRSLTDLKKMFEKELSETDTKHRLSLPSQYLCHFSNSNLSSSTPIEFRVLDRSGNSYTLRLKVRKEGYRKPEITGDWLRIIRDKNLKPYDIVIFYKHPDPMLFTIDVKRAVRVFGVTLGYADELIE